jgi:hypothetical protein
LEGALTAKVAYGEEESEVRLQHYIAQNQHFIEHDQGV